MGVCTATATGAAPRIGGLRAVDGTPGQDGGMAALCRSLRPGPLRVQGACQSANVACAPGLLVFQDLLLFEDCLYGGNRGILVCLGRYWWRSW